MLALPFNRENRHLARAMLGGAILGAVVSISAPVFAGDDDVAPDTKFFRSVLKGLGLRDDGSNIEYRERSPLVIPPDHTLPPPETSAVKDPNWPVDPEIKQREASEGKSALSLEEEARPLRPDQLMPGRKPGKYSRKSSSADSVTSGDDRGNPLSPSQLGYTGGLFGMFKSKNDEIGKFVSEPPRASLTDPPSGYQTPSSASPYGLGKDMTKPVPENPMDRAPKNN